MNKLEEYRDSSNPYKPVESPLEDIQKLRREGYGKGFDAAIALDLPVKFAEWYHNMIGEEHHKMVEKLNISEGEKGWKKFDTEREKFKKIPTKKHFQYWIDNIYKPE